MHPDAFNYFDYAPNVKMKVLGRFYDQPGPEGDISIFLIKMSKGGKFTFRPERAQTAWALSSGLEIEGKAYPERTFIYSPKGEAGEMSCTDEIEIYAIEFPDPA